MLVRFFPSIRLPQPFPVLFCVPASWPVDPASMLSCHQPDGIGYVCIYLFSRALVYAPSVAITVTCSAGLRKPENIYWLSHLLYSIFIVLLSGPQFACLWTEAEVIEQQSGLGRRLGRSLKLHSRTAINVLLAGCQLLALNTIFFKKKKGDKYTSLRKWIVLLRALKLYVAMYCLRISWSCLRISLH